MTCKISFIKTIRETIKHHIASVFSVCLVFFIQLIVFFLEVQSYASEKYIDSLDKNYIAERLKDLTSPSLAYVIPVILVALLLAFDFFRYLHSKKQIDFYESLPIQRKIWFLLRTASAGIIFIIPYIMCILLEVVLLITFGFFNTTLLCNLLWNAACMILVFLIVFLTGVLSMVLTGHSVIAFFGFCTFSVYAPILLRYIYPAYANEYFQTYMMDNSKLFYLNYLSPLGLAYKLTHSYYYWTLKDHIIDFIAIIVMIVFVGFIAYLLFKRRPSEAAGRAMAFEKWNPVIRILLVIPLTLYIGLYLGQVASMGSKIWMVFGFVIATVLLHGIIESIFQFDIRGLWSRKRQMIGCFIVSFVIVLIFWLDFFHYDQYLPSLNKLETITITCNGVETTAQASNGISGDNLKLAHQLAQNVIDQNVQLGDERDHEWIMFDYHLKNGTVKTRQYYMDYNSNHELFDKIFATKDFKDDVCQLYNDDWSKISHISWGDGISEVTLYLTEEEKETLFDTYIAEYTPVTYSYMRETSSIGYFTTHGQDDEAFYNYSCYVYPSFTQTIALLEKYMLADENAKDFGSLTESPLDKYQIQSLEIYCEHAPVTISDIDQIQSIKEDMIYMDNYYLKYGDIDYNLYYDAGVSVKTSSGFEYISVLIPKDVADKLME